MEAQGLSKIKFKLLERQAEDRIKISFVGFFRNNMIHGEAFIQDKWEGENCRYLKLTQKDFWQLDLIDHVRKFDAEHLAPQDQGKPDSPAVEILDFSPY